MQQPLRIVLATGWFLFISFLFFLPGSALPSNDWLSKINFDKFVHIGFFALLLFLWIWALAIKNKKALVILTFLAIIYGLVIEVCQDKFVANRSFDSGDILADFVGSIIGSWVGYKKNKPL